MVCTWILLTVSWCLLKSKYLLISLIKVFSHWLEIPSWDSCSTGITPSITFKVIYFRYNQQYGVQKIWPAEQQFHLLVIRIGKRRIENLYSSWGVLSWKIVQPAMWKTCSKTGQYNGYWVFARRYLLTSRMKVLFSMKFFFLVFVLGNVRSCKGNQPSIYWDQPQF